MPKTVHVIHNDDGWMVKREGRKADGVYDTKREAVASARDIARNASGQLVIHGVDGRIQQHGWAVTRCRLVPSSINHLFVNCPFNEGYKPIFDAIVFAVTDLKNLPGGKDIIQRHRRFRADLPALCEAAKLKPDEVTFKELRQMIGDWLKRNR